MSAMERVSGERILWYLLMQEVRVSKEAVREWVLKKQGISSLHNMQLRCHGMLLVLQVDDSSRGDWSPQSIGKKQKAITYIYLAQELQELKSLGFLQGLTC